MKVGIHGAVVEFCGVSKRFGSVIALEDFTLRVEAGEFLTLLGPSGSGKTTALNVLAGFEPLTSGDILIDGRSVADVPTEKRNVGMVFQNYSLFPHMTVQQNVAFPLRMRGVSRATIRLEVEAALKLVDLDEYGPRLPSQLSGGQRQRVAFARAIVFRPKVLLMDEPLSALDLKLRERMQLEIKHYQKQIGCTVIYVTHDQGEALTLSDKIVVMREHRIRQIGTPQEIYNSPATRFIADFIGETNIIETVPQGDGWWFAPDLGTALPRAVADRERRHLSLRPENLFRWRDGEAPPNAVRFSATVAEMLFLGDIVRYRMLLPTGRVLLFQEHRSGNRPLLEPGATVPLWFRTDDVRILSDEE